MVVLRFNDKGITRKFILQRLTEVEQRSRSNIEIRKILRWDRKTEVWYFVGKGKSKKAKYRMLET